MIKKTLLLFVFFIAAQNMVYSQITVNVKNQTIQHVFRLIEKNSDFKFFYPSDLSILNREVSIQIENGTIDKILNLLLAGTNLQYKKAENNLIIISEKSVVLKNKSISGIVTNEKGEEIIGANIKVKGTSKGAVTDINGKYALVVPENSVIQVSYVGYKTKEVEISTKNSYNIMLSGDSKSLDELVIVGYNTMKRSDLTGAISSVSEKSIEERSITSFTDVLKGQAAGIQIIQNDGSPGASATIRIRGANSINASSEPYFIIDGIPGSPENVAPNDIASIEILKDASSTAIYGARGGNGVILITTKKATKGTKSRVDINAHFEVQQVTRLYDMMEANDYLQMLYRYDWKSKPASYIMTTPETASYHQYFDKKGGSWLLPKNGFDTYISNSYASVNNTNWQKAMMRNGINQQYNISINGTSNNLRYTFMGNYNQQQGVIEFSNYRRFGGRLNMEHDMSKTTKIGINIAADDAKFEGTNVSSPSNGVMIQILRSKPNIALIETGIEEDEMSQDFISSNPYYNAQNITTTMLRDNYTTRFYLEQKILKKLIFKTTGSVSKKNYRNESYYPSVVGAGRNSNGRAVINDMQYITLLNENFLYYNDVWADYHTFKAMIAGTVEQQSSYSLSTENQNFTFDDLGVSGIGQGTNPVIPINSSTMWRIVSFFGNINYDYKNKYLLTSSFRADGSSRFGTNNKWGYFPSVAFAWRLSNEDFIKNLKFFDNLKLRLSSGISGNSTIPPYRSLSTLVIRNYPMDGNTTIHGGQIIEQPSNQNLSWEKTAQYNIGLDMGFLQNRLSFTFQGYYKKTTDLLLQLELPLYTGYKNMWNNVGSIDNRGLEFETKYIVVNRKNFNCEFNLNAGTNKMKVLNIGNKPEMLIDPVGYQQVGNMVQILKGQSIQWYGFKTNGIYASQEEIDNLPDDYSQDGAVKNNIQVGMLKYVDVDKSGKIDDNDKTALGYMEPIVTGGFGGNLEYKGFSVNLAFLFSYGSKVCNMNKLSTQFGQISYNNEKSQLNCFLPDLYDANGLLMQQGNMSSTIPFPHRGTNFRVIDQIIEDASFLRLSDLTFSYSLPIKACKYIKLDRLRFFASGKNLFLLTKYSGYDPEVSTSAGNYTGLVSGIDYMAYPRTKSIALGFNMNF